MGGIGHVARTTTPEVEHDDVPVQPGDIQVLAGDRGREDTRDDDAFHLSG